MAALVSARPTPMIEGVMRDLPVKAATTIHQGGMVQIDAAGYAVPASATAANVTVGRAEASANNSAGANGAISVKVRSGVFRFANSAAGDLIARTEIGKAIFVVDDQTLAKTDATGARPKAGTCFDVDAQGVWVKF